VSEREVYEAEDWAYYWRERAEEAELMAAKWEAYATELDARRGELALLLRQALLDRNDKE
jgi:hypothetical protein